MVRRHVTLASVKVDVKGEQCWHLVVKERIAEIDTAHELHRKTEMNDVIHQWIISTFPGWNKGQKISNWNMNFISPIQNKKNVKSLQYSVNVNFCLFGNIFHTETDT